LRVAKAKASKARRVAQWKRCRSSLTESQKLTALVGGVIATGALAESIPAIATAHTSFELAMVREEARSLCGHLDKFRADPRNSAASVVPSAITNGVVQVQDLIPLPCSQGKAFEFAPDIAPTCERALNYISTNTASSKLGIALDLDWSRRTSSITQAGLPPIPPKSAAATKKDKCRSAGECLCKGDGKRLKSFFYKLCFHVIKHNCKPGSRGRSLLTSGYIVVGLFPMDMPEDHRAPLNEIAAPDFVEGKTQASWYHVGLQYLSPYKPCVHVLRPSNKPPLMDGLLNLRATGSFPNTYTLLAELDKSRIWWGGLFSLWESDRLLTQIEPAEVSVRAMVEPVMFWTGLRRKIAKRETLVVPDDGAHASAGSLGAIAGGAGEIDADVEVVESDVSSLSSEGGAVEGDARDEAIDDMMALFFDEVDFAEESGAIAPRADVEPGAGFMLDLSDTGGVRDTSALTSSVIGACIPGSSSDPPPPPIVDAAAVPAPIVVEPPPLAAPEALPAARGPRDAGLHRTDYNGGHVTFYPSKDGRGGRFQANFGNAAAHGPRCRMTRTSNPSARPNVYPAQGRPLGLIAAWLAMSDTAGSQDEHAALAVFFTHGERETHRIHLSANTNGLELSAHERKQRDDEGLEPYELA
jgi:hypothetical protein